MHEYFASGEMFLTEYIYVFKFNLLNNLMHCSNLMKPKFNKNITKLYCLC